MTSSSTASTSASASASEKEGWGANFWVTLADPSSGAEFYACPATGECAWDPPEGNFVLPRSADGEWWEIEDTSGSGLPYYYHTKSGDTVWTRPEGFVIPLAIIQTTTLGKRLSTAYLSPRTSIIAPAPAPAPVLDTSPATLKQDPAAERLTPPATPTIPQARSTPPTSNGVRASPPTSNSNGTRGSPPQSNGHAHPSAMRASRSSGSSRRAAASPTRVAFADLALAPTHAAPPPISVSPPTPSMRAQRPAAARPPVSGHPTPVVTANLPGQNGSAPPSAYNSNGRPAMPRSGSVPSVVAGAGVNGAGGGGGGGGGGQRMRSKSSTQLRSSSEDSYGPPLFNHGHGQNQSLQAAAELIAGRRSVSGPRPSNAANFYAVQKASASSASLAIKREGRARGQSLKGMIGAPVVDYEAARRMAPRWEGAGPVPVGSREKKERREREREEGDRIGFPRELKEEIQQFAGSDFARLYFAKHSTGLIFRRRVPVEKMMTWQKAPLTTSLLNVPRSLQRDAVRIFRALQKIMGDGATSPPASANTREEARWVLGEGVAHGELRDEVYCQLVKQLSANPNPQSVFKGWQFLCVLLITFPPSKNFETYLYAFLDRHLGVSEGRIDVMAKYCLRRLPIIARKGPRGRPPTVGEIESASDAAFNPSTFGEPLDAVMRLQARTYPGEGVPIVLPFLADGILALGGTRAEGIFRVPGDGDAVAELKLRIDRGYYTLDGIDDPHVPASLLKLWLRELQEPLVPDELYDECIGADVLGAVQLVARLPTHNRRVVAFVVSFLQLFLEERVTARTKMTAPNLALVMAPNLVRCASESAAVVFANAQHEQRFVLNLLLNLHCDEIDPDFRPVHGRGRTA